MKNVISVFTFSLILFSCGDKKKDDNTTTTPDINNITGYSILTKLPGIWNGGVSSTTAIGSYPEWIVDFRPISSNQVSSKNELDSLNDIVMSVFVVKQNNQYKLCFRNGGGFAGYQRISYLIIDSVYESTPYSYYRFSEIVKGKNRAYSEFMFKGDSVILRSYTNKSNSLTAATLHMDWRAKLQDLTSAQAAISKFTFPKKEMTKDFSSTFSGASESIFYNGSGDPYTSAQQPYVGQTNVTVSFTNGLVADASKKTIIMITTQPLINGVSFDMNALKYRSRYVEINGGATGFNFKEMHPGNYYIYALHDLNGNLTFDSGDYVSTTNTTFTVPEKATVNVAVQVNFQIP